MGPRACTHPTMAAQAEFSVRHQSVCQERSRTCHSQPTTTPRPTRRSSRQETLKTTSSKTTRSTRKSLRILPQQVQFWSILYQVASDTKQEYEATKSLRSGRYHSEEVLVLYRLTNHLEQPWRSKAKARLAKVLEFKNQSVPLRNRALKVWYMAHDSFPQAMRTFLGNLTRQYRHVPIPYHLPTHKPREDAPERLMAFLWNHNKNITGAGRQWQPTACNCDQLLRLHPQLQHKDGPIATGLELFKFPRRLQHLTQCGASNAVFPTKKEFMHKYRQKFSSWLRHHQFPKDQYIINAFMDFLQQQLQEHTQALRHQPRLRKRDVKQIFSIIPNDYITHNENHANAHLMVYCSNLYNQAAFNTWFDKGTFAVMDEDEDTIKNNMRKNLPQHIARKYKKILDFKKPLPYGYIMMKRKKKWNKVKGRTIVASGHL